MARVAGFLVSATGFRGEYRDPGAAAVSGLMSRHEFRGQGRLVAVLELAAYLHRVLYDTRPLTVGRCQ